MTLRPSSPGRRAFSARRVGLLLAAFAAPLPLRAQQPVTAGERLSPGPRVPAETHASAPIVRTEGARGAGRIVGAVDSFEDVSFSRTDQLQFGERAYVTGPGGTAAVRGRYLVVDSAATLTGGAQVYVPTGIVEVERAAPGQAATARIVDQFATVRVGQLLLPLEEVPRSGTRVAAVDGPLVGQVVWRPGHPALPGVLQWAVLAPAAGAEVRPGDELAFVRPATTTPTGVMLPEEELGRAVVVRTSAGGITALITDLAYGVVMEGTVARLAGRAN